MLKGNILQNQETQISKIENIEERADNCEEAVDNNEPADECQEASVDSDAGLISDVIFN